MQVTVIGGGVAGSVCAIALRRIGADVTIYEAYPDPAGAIGSFLSIASNGLRALDAVGCLDAVRDAGTPVPTQRMWSGGGRLLGETPRGRLAADPTHSVTLRRADLVTVLRDAAARAGARIVTGEKVVAATDAGDHVHASFDSGNTVDSDLLIGADGIWSTVRTILDANAPRPAYAGMYSVSGLSTTRTEPGVFIMIVGRAGAFIHVAGPDGTTWWSAQVAEPSAPDLAAVNLPMLLDRYRHEEQVVAVLRQATTMHQPTLDHVLDPVPTWRSDRTVIVGDAAHPVGAGQGASMAIEDAIVLAQRLTLGNGMPAALAAYEDARRARTTRMLKAGQDNRARKKVPGPVRRRVNETVMSFGLEHFYEKAMGWLYTYDVGELPVRV
jgi:2-polyprenyl-6-methoxyphenol hydroxylase-like FAD-dependent oxidoreductase